MITGINHITLSVRSLDDSFTFYKNVLGFKPLMRKEKSAYFLAGDLWFCIEEDSAARMQQLPEYTHIAFSVSQNDFRTIANKIRTSNTSIFKDNKSEGDSIYFLDPTGHKLEIHVGDWKSRLEAYRGQADTEFFD
jgi:catechol 2,3-dioxygenase-like lactoylglutathione lyase family enzyme